MKIRVIKDTTKYRIRVNATEFSEGDEVDTPDGVGVVVEVRTEDFEGPDGEVEASDDNPAYVVGTENDVQVYRASEIESTTIETDVDNPEEDVAEETTSNVTANQPGRFNFPESWKESDTPNRIILLKAWAGMGGTFRGCRREMRGELVGSANRFCGAMKDRVLFGWTGWRNGG